MTAPVIEAGDITSAGYTGPPTVSSAELSFATINPGDLTIWHLSTDTGNGAHEIPSSGPGGSTITTIEANTTAGAGGPVTSIWWSIASVTATASTLAIQLGASLAGWAGNTIRVPAGEFNSSAPIQTNYGVVGQSGATATASSPTWTTDNRAEGRVVIYIAVDTEAVSSASSATGYSNRYNFDHGRVGTFIATRDAEATSSESINEESWGLTGSDTYTAHGYVVNGVTTTASAPPAGAFMSIGLLGVGF